MEHSNLLYRVDAKGRISAQRRGRRGVLPDVWLEMPVQPGPARKELHRQVSHTFVRAAIAIFGRRPYPADLNELTRFKDALLQTQKDAPALLPVVYCALNSGDLAPKPVHSVVARLKALLTAPGVAEWARKLEDQRRRDRFDPPSKPRKVKLNEVQRFWNHYTNQKDYPPFTEATWRWLGRQSFVLLREQFTYFHQVRYKSKLWNMLVELQVDPVPPELLSCAERLQRSEDFRELIRSVAQHLRDGGTLEAGQLDDVVDLIHEAQARVNPGTRWSNVVKRAADYASLRADLSAADMAKYSWDPLITPFVTGKGIVVTPLTDGAELVREGHEMRNCLRNTASYAQRALDGTSRVVRLQGLERRATVELGRRDLQGLWVVEQLRGRFNTVLADATLRDAAQQAAQRLNERAN